MNSRKFLNKLNLATSGYFVDWDGRIREAANPGNGMFCVILSDDNMDVVDAEGETNYECTRYEKIEDIMAIVPSINPEIVSNNQLLHR